MFPNGEPLLTQGESLGSNRQMVEPSVARFHTRCWAVKPCVQGATILRGGVSHRSICIPLVEILFSSGYWAILQA
jgi:hypothetical protein